MKRRQRFCRMKTWQLSFDWLTFRRLRGIKGNKGTEKKLHAQREVEVRDMESGRVIHDLGRHEKEGRRSAIFRRLKLSVLNWYWRLKIFFFFSNLTRVDARRPEVFKKNNIIFFQSHSFLVFFCYSSLLPVSFLSIHSPTKTPGLQVRARLRWSRRFCNPNPKTVLRLIGWKQTVNDQCISFIKPVPTLQQPGGFITAAAGKQWRLRLISPREPERVHLAWAFGISVHSQCKWLPASGATRGRGLITLSVIERAASLSRNVAEEREPLVAFSHLLFCCAPASEVTGLRPPPFV